MDNTIQVENKTIEFAPIISKLNELSIWNGQRDDISNELRNVIANIPSKYNNLQFYQGSTNLLAYLMRWGGDMYRKVNDWKGNIDNTRRYAKIALSEIPELQNQMIKDKAKEEKIGDITQYTQEQTQTLLDATNKKLSTESHPELTQTYNENKYELQKQLLGQQTGQNVSNITNTQGLQNALSGLTNQGKFNTESNSANLIKQMKLRVAQGENPYSVQQPTPTNQSNIGTITPQQNTSNIDQQITSLKTQISNLQKATVDKNSQSYLYQLKILQDQFNELQTQKNNTKNKPVTGGI